MNIVNLIESTPPWTGVLPIYKWTEGFITGIDGRLSPETVLETRAAVLFGRSSPVCRRLAVALIDSTHSTRQCRTCKSAGGVLSRARCVMKFLADSCNLTRHTKFLFKRPASHLPSPVSFHHHHQPPVDRRTRILPGKLTCTYVFNICGFGAMTGGNTSYRSLLDLVFDSCSLGPADFWRLTLHGANFSLAAGLTSVPSSRSGRVGRAVSRCNGNPLSSAC